MINMQSEDLQKHLYVIISNILDRTIAYNMDEVTRGDDSNPIKTCYTYKTWEIFSYNESGDIDYQITKNDLGFILYICGDDIFFYQSHKNNHDLDNSEDDYFGVDEITDECNYILKDFLIKNIDCVFSKKQFLNRNTLCMSAKLYVDNNKLFFKDIENEFAE